MKIRKVILKGVCNFRDFERCFEDDWSRQVPNSLLLIGPNGSGKTTLLNVIAGLWQVLSDFLVCDERRKEGPFDGLLSSAKLAAVEITGLRDEPLWIYAGTHKASLQEFIAAHTDQLRVGQVYSSGNRSNSKRGKYQYAKPGAMKPTEVDGIEQLPPWAVNWSGRLTENLLGKRHDLPNLVYLESETRILQHVREKFSVQPEPEEYRRLARYEPTTSRKGSLQNYLYNLKVVDETTFEAIVEQVNSFLVNKQLDHFDRRTGNLMVRVENGDQHPIEKLSSGEKQVLLMLATITRWLRKGGIVLIDEPDLHLHVSLMTAFVSHLRRMVAEREGQLILASHAPELWRDFTASHLVRLGDLNSGEASR